MGDTEATQAAAGQALTGRQEGSDTGAVDWAGAVQYALARLRQGLPPELTYHNLYHTEEDVLPAARRLAALSGVDEEGRRLLEVAAAYHDIGFTVQAQEHEQLSAEIAAGVLPSFGFAPAQVAAIQGMIMATRWPQSPGTLLEEILADADLDVLGREDFHVRNQALRAELATQGTHLSTEAWMRTQLELLQNHRYFTAAAQGLRDAGKRKNLIDMEERLAGLTGQATEEGGVDDGSH